MKTKIKHQDEINATSHFKNNENHHNHEEKKSCCGDCKGQGSCGKLTKVTLISESLKDIAHIK